MTQQPYNNTEITNINKKQDKVTANDLVPMGLRNYHICWFDTLQAIHKQNNRPTIPDTFIINGKSNSNISEIAEEFNNFFVNIGEQTAKNLPQPTNSFSDYLNENYAAIFLCFPPAKQKYCIQQQT